MEGAASVAPFVFMDAASLTAWINEDFTFRATLVVGAMVIFAAGPPLAIAAYLWRIGTRTLAANRYPPPGIRLLRDVPPVTGSAAASRGRLLRAFSSMLAVSALLIAAVLLRFLWVALSIRG